MTVLKSLLSNFRKSRNITRKSRRTESQTPHNSESLEQRLLLTNPDLFDSNPGAPISIYLDFDLYNDDSAAWEARREGTFDVISPRFDLDGNRNNWTIQEREVIEEIYLRVAEDFSPFDNVTVTTEEPDSFAVGTTIRVAIGGDSNPFPNGSDPADWSLRSFNNAIQDGFTDTTNSSNTVFVFPQDFTSHPRFEGAVTRPGQLGRDVAYSASEAIGIALGLDEPTRGDTPEASAIVNDDNNAFPPGWRDTWSNAGGQDDISIITNNTNSFTVRPDDHGDSLTFASPISLAASGAGGFIEANGDVDFFQFSTAGGTTTITAQANLDLANSISSQGNAFSNNGVTNPGANLNPTVQLFDANGVALTGAITSNGLGTLGSQIVEPNLPAGIYFIAVSNGGEYGNIGAYSVSIGGVTSEFEVPVPFAARGLSSFLPAAAGPDLKTIYLDFNGGVVTEDSISRHRADGVANNFYVPPFDLDGDKTTFSAAEEVAIQEIRDRVAEDFAPFNINITTSPISAFPNQEALQVIIGGDGSWLSTANTPLNTTGTGFIDWLTDVNTGPGAGYLTPNVAPFANPNIQNVAIAFPDVAGNNKDIAAAATGIILNSFGVEPAFTFAGNAPNGLVVGQPALGPVGGNSSASLRDTLRLSDGSVPSPQDPIEIITSPRNLVRFRADDHGQNVFQATPLDLNTPVNERGIIGRVFDAQQNDVDDADWFRFRARPSTNVRLSVSGIDLTAVYAGATNPGTNFDPVLQLFRDNGTTTPDLVASSGIQAPALSDGSPASVTAEIFLPTLEVGDYFVAISNQYLTNFQGFPVVQDPAQYGNLGQYTFEMTGALPPAVELSFNETSVLENAGLQVGFGRITRPEGTPDTTEITVELGSSDTSELTFPQSTITIPAGVEFVDFDVEIVDDAFLDGDQFVELSVSVGGEVNAVGFITVLDHETISVSLAGNQVAEPVDDQPIQVPVTVTRSNVDSGPDDHWVARGTDLLRYDAAGTLLDTIPIPYPNPPRPSFETVHDIQVLDDGRVAVFNGTVDGFLAVYNPSSTDPNPANHWLLQPFADPSDRINASGTDPSTGGVTSIGNYVFVTDLDDGDGQRGLLRFDMSSPTNDPVRFGQAAVGSRLFTINGNELQEINSQTGELIKSIPVPPPTVGQRQTITVAFDGEALWVLTDISTNQGGFFFDYFESELLKIDPDSEMVLERHALPGLSSNAAKGMTILNNRIYINDPTGVGVFSEYVIKGYDPVTRQFVGNQIALTTLNGLFVDPALGAIQADNIADGRLLVLGMPKNTPTFFTDANIYEINLANGQATQVPGALVQQDIGILSFGTNGITAIADATVGTTTHDHVIYVNGDPQGIQLFDRDGNRLDNNPATGPIDLLDNGGYSFNQDIGGGDVPGVITADQNFRDVAVGLHDGLLYGLFETGLGVAVYNPETLAQLATIDLDAAVNTLSIGVDGTMYGGANGGIIRVFDPVGQTQAIYNTGLGHIVDVETNVSLAFLASDVNGQVISGSLEDLAAGTLASLENTGDVSFISFARNPDLPSGDLFVTLTSSDLTEIGIPAASQTVVIPAGQQSITVMVDVLPDALLDGTQLVTLVGSADHYISESPVISVIDSEEVGIETSVPLDPTTMNPTLFENDLPYPSAIRVFRTDLDGPYTEEAFTRATASGQKPAARPVFSTPITDNGVTTSTIEIPAQRSSITDLNVTLNIEHANPADLTAVLISPAGTRVPLFTNPTITGTSLTETTFDDEASRSLENDSSVAPYTGIYRPQGSLSDFDEQNPSGQWTLELTDNATGNTGVLLDWSLDIQTPSAPLAIVDRDVTLSEIVIPAQNSIITDLNVTITLQHSFIPDLDVFLVSPQGTRVELFTDLGSNESSMTNTIFDDEAATRIVDGSSPYTGRFIPEELLSKLDGENPSGRWTLEISDDNITDSGVLLDWALDIETLGLAPATVTVVSNDPSEILLSFGNQVGQASVDVTFPAATSELFVDLIPQDDQIVDGTQQVSVTATNVSLPGFNNGSTTIDVLDVETLTLAVSASQVSEAAGSGALIGTVTRSDSTRATPLVVTLMSTDTSELAVPTTVVIPPMESSATFLIDAVDDFELDGDQTGIQILATAPGYVDDASEDITVTDEEPRLSLSTFANPSFEDDGNIDFFVTRLDANDLTSPQEVALTSSDPSALTVPATVTIPANQLSVSFVATALSDDVVDGTQIVTITADDPDTLTPTVSGDTFDLTILDSEAVIITVAAGDESFVETAGTTVEATVSLSALIPNQDVVVTLTNSDLTEISIPAQVVIPAGETSATFTISSVDDDRVDRAQMVSITGSATSYLDGVLDLTVLDHEPPVSLSPVNVTPDSTPALQWGAVDGATRYDLWVNDVSRNIVQLYRLENFAASAPLFTDNFESGSFATEGWTNDGATIDDVALNEQNGSLSARLNGDPASGDSLISPTFDLSSSAAIWGGEEPSGVQLRYSFQQTGGGESPGNGEDLVISYRNAAGQWIVVERQNGSGEDMTVFEDSTIFLPADALHANFAFRFQSIGKSTQPNIDGEEVPGIYDDWFIDNVELARLEQFVPPQEMGVGIYRYWVRAYDSLEQPGFWSAGNTFRVTTPPVFINPVNGAGASSTPPTLSWSTVVDSNYDLWVNDITRGVSQVIREVNLDTTSFATLTAGLLGGTYKAWVRATAPDGFNGDWSAPVTFSILGSPTGLRPTGSTFDRTPELGWNEVEGADRYYVWLNRRLPGGGSEIVLRDQFVNGTTRIPPQDLVNGNYTFWVRAIAADGTQSVWSAPTSFTVGGRPVVTDPASGSTIAAGSTITFTGIDQAARYEIWINRIDIPQSRAVYDPNVLTTSFDLPAGIAVGDYRIWIRAVSEMGEFSAWSVPVDFSIAAEGADTDLSIDGPEIQLASAPADRIFHDTFVVTGVAEPEQMMVAAAAPAQPVSPAEQPVELPAEDERELDSVMTEWAVGELATENLSEESNDQAASAAVLGLGLGLAVARPRRRSLRKDEQS
ncbi:MAG: proprotein convertase P-domain-containing protein [Planctomycetaceae bacterium]|nr:proprotein convertase P-domain-containing protein [Planctomycetaceae bacterium]